MFTILQNATFGLTKSELKWGAENASALKTPLSTDDLIKLAKSKLDEASKQSDSIVA